MVNLIRRFQQPLMIIITVVVIIAFAWLYNSNQFLDKGGNGRVGVIYGRNISQAEFQREARKYELCQYLLRDLWQTLIQPAQNADEATTNYVWNTLVLQHEADRLGINTTQAERDAAIKSLPAFQTNGNFDSSKLNQFAGYLASRGLTTDALEELVANDLRLEKIKTLVGTTAPPAPSEVHAIFEQRSSKMECQVLRWKLEDFLKDQQVTPDDLKKTYEERKATLLTDEQRRVKFVALTLPNVEKPLVGKERVDKFAVLSTQAQDFAEAMTDKAAEFDKVAAKVGVKAGESPLFTLDKPPAELGSAEEVAQAAFKLTKEQPNSDPVQIDKGYYILQLMEVVPARQETLEEAAPKLTESMRKERANEALTLKTTEIRNKIEAELKAGKTFAEAAATAGVKPEPFPAFSMAEPPMKEPNIREVAMSAMELKPGALSEFIPTGMDGSAEGGLMVYLDKKTPGDAAAFDKDKTMLAEQISRGKREAVFQYWLKLRRADAKVQTAERRS